MSSAKQATVLSADDADTIKHCLNSARKAVLQVLFSASMTRENAVTPNWDTDLADPAMEINAALCHIESALKLNAEQEARAMARRLADLEGSAES